MITPAYFLSLRDNTPTSGYWDYALLVDILARIGAVTSEVSELPKTDTAIVVIPARSHFEMVDQINAQLANIKNVVLFLMGDEEAIFPVEKIAHSNIAIWVQNARPGRHNDFRRIGCGYPPQIRDVKNLYDKTLDWFFAGQITHQRRIECASMLRHMAYGKLLQTTSFTSGFPPSEYYEHMSRARVAPCPSGPETPDSFRLFEALELGLVPIADTQTPKENWQGFWTWLFGEPVPFGELHSYESLPGYVTEYASAYPAINNRVQSWWQRYKSKLCAQLKSDIKAVSGDKSQDNITIIIPVSPIPSHPKTAILMETINSVRYHFPRAEVLITFDGVRPEQEHMRADYEEHVRRVLHECRFLGNVTPFVFEEHLHQSGMMRYVLPSVNTKFVMYVEQDTPLVTDEPTEWGLIYEALSTGTSNVVRLYHEGLIPAEHNHLMLLPVTNHLLPTIQWSQRPHIATTAFYRHLIEHYFTDSSRCFLEDLLHGKLQEAYNTQGMIGWFQWRVHIYIPNDKNSKRSYHTDGRNGAAKYDDQQKW